jgi:hypothetical protein
MKKNSLKDLKKPFLVQTHIKSGVKMLNPLKKVENTLKSSESKQKLTASKPSYNLKPLVTSNPKLIIFKK